MIDIDDLLADDAADWQRAVDAGARREQLRPRRARTVLISAAVVIALVTAVLVAVALNRSHHRTPAAPPSDLSTLLNRTWTDSAAQATVTFTTRTLRYDDGCTSYASYLRRLVVSDRTLVPGRLIGPGIACSPEAAPTGGPALRRYDRRQAALDRLNRVLAHRMTWTVRDGLLRLTGSSGTTITLDDSGVAPQVIGTHWLLARAIAHGTEVRDVPSGLTLAVKADGGPGRGVFRMYASCGRFDGSLIDTGTELVLSHVHTFTTSCAPPQAGHLFDLIQAVITGTVSYAIRGTELILYGPHGDALTYRPATAPH